MKNQVDTAFYCGTSNVVIPVPSKALLPPEYHDKSRLQYYASLLNSVEINSTFYRLPLARTVEKWASEVHDQFRFTFKFSKTITHAKGLQYDIADIDRFLQVVSMVGTKKGCILIQFPGSIKITSFHKVAQVLDQIKSNAASEGWRFAVEFRDKSWYCDEVYMMLEEFKMSIVIHDIPKAITPLIDMEKGFVYLRFHGENGDYRGSYSDEFLEEQADYIRSWREEGLPVYAYFNNTMGSAIQNALKLGNLMI
ncbi:MAG: DUF72 domain-containing protein [Saprospiraceae bacterium]